MTITINYAEPYGFVLEADSSEVESTDFMTVIAELIAAALKSNISWEYVPWIEEHAAESDRPFCSIQIKEGMNPSSVTSVLGITADYLAATTLFVRA